MKACKKRLFGFSRKMFFHLSSFSTSHIRIKCNEKLLSKLASFNYIEYRLTKVNSSYQNKLMVEVDLT